MKYGQNCKTHLVTNTVEYMKKISDPKLLSLWSSRHWPTISSILFLKHHTISLSLSSNFKSHKFYSQFLSIYRYGLWWNCKIPERIQNTVGLGRIWYFLSDAGYPVPAGSGRIIRPDNLAGYPAK